MYTRLSYPGYPWWCTGQTLLATNHIRVPVDWEASRQTAADTIAGRQPSTLEHLLWHSKLPYVSSLTQCTLLLTSPMMLRPEEGSVQMTEIERSRYLPPPIPQSHRAHLTQYMKQETLLVGCMVLIENATQTSAKTWCTSSGRPDWIISPI